MKTTAAIVALSLVAFVIGTQVSRAEPATPTTAKREFNDHALIGLLWTAQPDGTLLISLVHPGTPAWNAGLCVGDTVLGSRGFEDGEEIDGVVPPAALQMGLFTSPPGTEFEFKIKRGATSLQLETTVREMEAKKQSIPACQVFFDHFAAISKGWKNKPTLWIKLKSISAADFSAFEMREQQKMSLRLQITELQTRIELERTQTLTAYFEIDKLIAEKRNAEAQAALAAVQARESGTNTAKTLLGLLFSFIL